jgi:hypothetical protein
VSNSAIPVERDKSVALLIKVFGFNAIIETLCTSKKLRRLFTTEQLQTLKELKAVDAPLPTP